MSSLPRPCTPTTARTILSLGRLRRRRRSMRGEVATRCGGGLEEAAAVDGLHVSSPAQSQRHENGERVWLPAYSASAFKGENYSGCIA